MIAKINDLLSELINIHDHEKELSIYSKEEVENLSTLLRLANNKINAGLPLNNNEGVDRTFITEIITVIMGVFSGYYEKKIPQSNSFLLNSLGDTINMLITELQWRTSELDKKNHFFSKMTETMSDVVFVYDIGSQTIVYKNKNDDYLSRLLGEPLFSERGLISRVIKKDKDRVEKAFKKCSVLQDENIETVEFRIKDKAGNLNWFLMKTSVFLSDSEGVATQLIYTIICTTALRLTELRKREKEEGFRKLSESSNDAIIVVNEHQKIISWSKGAEKMFKYKENEVLGINVAVIAPIKYKQEYEKAFQEVNRWAKINYFGIAKDIKGIDKNGEIFPVDINLSEWEVNEKKYFGAIIRDITQWKENERNLIQSNHEKEILLKEVHHRVKNNLQIINGLLDMQIRKVDDSKVKLVLGNSRSRIRTIAMVHEQLYHDKDLTAINFTKYLHSLCNEISIANFGNKNIAVSYECEDVSIDINKSIPLGLIANELLTNCYKHAFESLNEGKISIVLTQDEAAENCELLFIDNGKGLPADFDKLKERSLGYKIIDSLIDQIDGTLMHINTKSGLTTKICF